MRKYCRKNSNAQKRLKIKQVINKHISKSWTLSREEKLINELIEKMVIFIENDSITFKIFKERNFCFFTEKWVDSPNKIPTESFSYLPGKKIPVKSILF